MMFSTKKMGLAGLGLILAVGLSGCSGSSPSPSAGASTSTGPAATATPSSSVPPIARDGSSLIPTTEVGACSILSMEQIRAVLGDAARGIQSGEVAGTVSPSGVRHENCIYPLDTSGTTTHAVVLELVTYPDEASRANIDPWEAMMSPTEVTGLWGEARYATNRLSESTEHVLAVARGTQIWRFVVSQPQEVSTWEAPEGLAVLRKLAETARI
ncbi:hypothetical protein J2X01_004243 [Arthrobacter ginsengisoli]|uniref:DUF3558 domain-containing protein n=1 Tax=Arthrobacter ginsengisoli TaxID=1356565 RepID=A0ABU1UIB8_9MICC|nr:hypothetical protein [Arthrobacter ginsengisoli]MDR7084924.1 hypothetical protein [Arthrobacter ginsengisoli]